MTSPSLNKSNGKEPQIRRESEENINGIRTGQSALPFSTTGVHAAGPSTIQWNWGRDQKAEATANPTGIMQQNQPYHFSQQRFQPSDPRHSSSSFLLGIQSNHYNDEINQFLRSQEEQLRRMLAEKWQKHSTELVASMEELSTRKLREKEAALERAEKRCADLERRLAGLSTEALAWRSKALALHARLQHESNAGRAEEGSGESAMAAAEDAESAHVDPNPRAGGSAVGCRVCGDKVATVAVVPCRHLCLCSDCDAVSPHCPVCGCLKTGCLHVTLP